MAFMTRSDAFSVTVCRTCTIWSPICTNSPLSDRNFPISSDGESCGAAKAPGPVASNATVNRRER